MHILKKSNKVQYKGKKCLKSTNSSSIPINTLKGGCFFISNQCHVNLALKLHYIFKHRAIQMEKKAIKAK